MPNTAVEQLPEGVKVIDWDSWPNYPTWKTEKQLGEMGLMAWGDPVGAVWYSNKYIRRAGKKGHYLMLYDETLAKPKQVDEKKKEAAARAKETRKLNRTCSFCKMVYGHKIDHPKRICYDCISRAAAITTCQKWLALPNLVVLDTETTGLHPGHSEIIQIGIIDINGNVLLDTFVKPQNSIVEEFGEDEWPYTGRTAYQMNGISNEMVKDAPTFPELYPQLCEILKDKFVVIFNSEFDTAMIEGDCKRHGLSKPAWADTDCAMLMYTDYAGEWNDRRRRYDYVSLGDAVYQQKVGSRWGAHRALSDCEDTLAVIKSVAAKPKAEASDGTASN